MNPAANHQNPLKQGQSYMNEVALSINECALHLLTAIKVTERLSRIGDSASSAIKVANESMAEISLRYRFKMYHLTGNLSIEKLLLDPSLLEAFEAFMQEKYPHLSSEQFLADVNEGPYRAVIDMSIKRSVAKALLQQDSLTMEMMLADPELLEAVSEELDEKFPYLTSSQEFTTRIDNGDLSSEIDHTIQSVLESHMIGAN